MQSFLLISIISCLLVFLTSLINYEILRKTWNILPRLRYNPRLWTTIFLSAVFAGHIISIWIYALAYFLIEHHTSLGALLTSVHSSGSMQDDFLNGLYFSAATYSSLGLGDIFPTGQLRMVAGAEVLNGLCMIGWTVSFTYLAMQKFWRLPHYRFKRRKR